MAYIADNKKQMATAIVEIRKMATPAVEIGKTATVIIEIEKMAITTIEIGKSINAVVKIGKAITTVVEKKEKMDIDAINEKRKEMDIDAIKEKKKKMDTDAIFHTLISSGDDHLQTFRFLPAELSCITLIAAHSVRFFDVSKGNVQITQKEGKMVTLWAFLSP